MEWTAISRAAFCKGMAVGSKWIASWPGNPAPASMRTVRRVSPSRGVHFNESAVTWETGCKCYQSTGALAVEYADGVRIEYVKTEDVYSWRTI